MEFLSCLTLRLAMVKVSVVSYLINVILESDCTVRYSTICGLLCQIFIYYLNSPSRPAGLKVKRGLKSKERAKMIGLSKFYQYLYIFN